MILYHCEFYEKCSHGKKVSSFPVALVVHYSLMKYEYGWLSAHFYTAYSNVIHYVTITSYFDNKMPFSITVVNTSLLHLFTFGIKSVRYLSLFDDLV